MKRILLLLCVSLSLYADTLKDLEHAITKSDLAQVEQILSQEPTFTIAEQDMLINFAIEIVKKRENKIYMHEMVLARPGRVQEIKYMRENKEIRSFLKCALVGIIVPPIISTLCFLGTELFKRGSNAENTVGICGLISLFSWPVAMFIPLIKAINIENKLIAEHKELYKNRYNAAIKIKQLLCKFRVKIIDSNNQIN